MIYLFDCLQIGAWDDKNHLPGGSGEDGKLKED
jgi:hypothetical protein